LRTCGADDFLAEKTHRWARSQIACLLPVLAASGDVQSVLKGVPLNAGN